MSTQTTQRLARIIATLLIAGSPLTVATSTARAADAPDSKALLDAQRKAMLPLAGFDGLWRGPASVTLPNGNVLTLTQTERVGNMLDGTIKVIEGRGYGPDGQVSFNAFAVISFSPASGRYTFRSQAQGYSGDFPLQLTDDGFSWSIKAGPATLRYTARIDNGEWVEIGERLVDGQPPMRTFEMRLRRLGDTDWPAGGAVPPR